MMIKPSVAGDLKVVEMGATINARTGLNTWAAFTGTNEKAATRTIPGREPANRGRRPRIGYGQ